MNKFIKVLLLGIYLFLSFPVIPHLLEQTEEECKKIEKRSFNCGFRRILKPNNTHSDFQYKFVNSKNKIPLSFNKYKQYPSRYKEGATYSHTYSMIIVKFDNGKTIKERGVISSFPNIYTFQSKNFGYLVGTSCINIWYKNKKLESVCKQDFWK